jgi:hypothetical protein
VTTPLLEFFIAAPGDPFALFVPNNCPLVGLTVCPQGGSVEFGGTVHLANALDSTIGTY